jgi:hypothetical protein
MRWFWQKRKHYGVFSTIIVPLLYDFPDREKKAEEIKNWLIEIGAIQPKTSACVHYEHLLGYAIDKGAKKLTTAPQKLPFKKEANGLEIVTTQTTFDAGDDGIESIICPVCKKNVFPDYMMQYNFHKIKFPNLKCSDCEMEYPINDFHFNPAWAFSNLGFVFWNWRDFTPEFLEEFEKRLGCKIKVVECPQES